MHHGIHFPLFGLLSSPQVGIEIGMAAEEYGWDGVFVWDHLFSPVPGKWSISDPWIVLAAIATTTTTIRLGPMVCPLPRYRISSLAQQTVTLDHLSQGRLILGLGTGRDNWREYSAFGDDGSPQHLGRLLDQGVQVLTQLWSGKSVTFHGELTVEQAQLHPSPVQNPRIPLWFGTNRTTGTPIRRAACYDGIFPIGFLQGMPLEDLVTIITTITHIRGDLDDFDIAVGIYPDQLIDPQLVTLGVSWIMHTFWPGDTPDKILEFISHGPPQ